MSDRYVIMTESSCDLSQELVERAGLDVLPLTFTMEGKTYAHYPDTREYPLDRFYEKLKGGAVAVTAAANMIELSSAMEAHLSAGEDILFLCFSSGLSSTRDACAIAAQELADKYPDRKIYTVDTVSACSGQGLLAYLTAQKREAGATIEEARDFAESIKLQICHWFLVNDLMFLKRGGRVSSSAAVVGTMLNVKPILYVDNSGHLETAEKVRGRKPAMHRLLEKMEETALDPQNGTVMIAGAACPEDVETLRAMVEERFHPKELFLNEIGPIIGAHVGPGMLALLFVGEHR